MERVNHEVFLHGQDVKYNTKFMTCYSGVLCRKIYWCKHGYKLTVSGTVSTFSYLGATYLLTWKHCLSQFVLHVMAKVLNKKPRNKRNRCTIKRTLFTWTRLTQTPINLNNFPCIWPHFSFSSHLQSANSDSLNSILFLSLSASFVGIFLMLSFSYNPSHTVCFWSFLLVYLLHL